MTDINHSVSTINQERERLSKAGSLSWFHWIIVAGSLLLTLTAWYITNNQVKQRTQDQFLRQSEQVIELISERMQKYEDLLWSGVAALRFSSLTMNNEEWRRYADELNIEKKYPGINGIGIIYQVERGNIEPFIASQRQGRPNFTLYPEHERSILFPITYIEPLASNIQALGLDIAHETNRFNAAIKARDTGTAQITGPIILVQDSEKTPGFLFYTPAYRGDLSDHKSVKQRQEKFIGLVYAPFIFKKLLQGTLAETKRSVGLRIKDGDHILYDEISSDNANYDPKSLLKKTDTLTIYGREWVFDIQTNNEFREQNQNHQPWIILTGGIIIDSLLLSLFILIAKSNRQTINLANRLSQSYDDKTNDLEIANSELEEFAYRTSHDLRSPITSSLGLLDLSKKSIQNNKTDQALASIDYIEKSLNKLKSLIDDIFQITKIKKIEEQSQTIIIAELVNEILNGIDHLPNFKHISINKEFDNAPSIFTKKLRLQTIISNLISNAVKYHDPLEDQPFISISCFEKNEDFIFTIEDNGLGIPADQQEKLFVMFNRFHPQTAEGSGLGLYMVKKSSNIIDGTISYQETNKGSLFTLQAPKKLKEKTL